MALTDNLLCYYKLSDPTDETGNHAGTDKNTPTYAAGKIGNAVTFASASKQYIELANNFINVGAISVSVWLKTSSTAQYQTYFGISTSNNYYYIKFDLNGNGWGARQPGVWWRPNSLTAYRMWLSNDAIPSDSWAHVVVTFDGTTTAPIFYINGSPVSGVTVKQTSGTPSGVISSAPGAIGRGGGYDGYYSDACGTDELGVWSRVLSAAEVTALYNSAAGLQYPFTTGPDFTKMQINIGDAWKLGAGAQINIGDAWKQVSGLQINIGDAWKTIF